jgi:hypothetical protein
MSDSKTFSLTFGDVAENHKGMQKIGTLSNVGFNLSDMIDLLVPESQAEDASIFDIGTNKYLAHNLDIFSAQEVNLDFTVPIRLVIFFNFYF